MKKHAIALSIVGLFLSACNADDMTESDEEVVAEAESALVCDGATAPATKLCNRNLWLNGYIPYSFDSSVQPDTRQGVLDAMANWEAVTGGTINFEEDASNSDRLVIVQNGNNEAGIPGWDGQPNTVQYVYLNAYSAPHELGHVIGLSHEHQRFDRDRYIIAGFDMWYDCERYSGNGLRCDKDSTGSDFGEYNTGSTLHYSGDANFPYCRRAGDPEPACTSASPNYLSHGYQVTPQDGSNVREMYAYGLGWTKFVSLGRDVGATKPLSNQFVPGVMVVGKPALTSQRDGSNNMFVRGSDNQLWHRFRVGTSWSSWYPMGGSLASSPAAASFGPGSVIVVAKLTNGKIGIWQYANNSWTGPAELGTVSSNAWSAPALASWGNNRLDMFIRGSDGALWWASHDSIFAATLSSTWTAWQSVGGQFVNDPAAVSWGPNRIDVVVTTTGQGIWHWAYNNGVKSWDSLGCCGDTSASPSIASRGSNSLNVVMKGSDGQLWHKYWTSAGWSDWAELGGILNSSPAIVGASSSRLDVVALGTDGALKHRFWGN